VKNYRKLIAHNIVAIAADGIAKAIPMYAHWWENAYVNLTNCNETLRGTLIWKSPLLNFVVMKEVNTVVWCLRLL
jgi:hypothetical protein